MIIPGPFGDGFDSHEYVQCIQDASEFFGYDNETCVDRMVGPAIFKKDMEEHGLEWTYDNSEGAIWDLLSVRATISQGIKERGREDLVKRILEMINPNGDELAIADYGCGIGREILVALNMGHYGIGVDRGKTIEFATFYVNKYKNRDLINHWNPMYPPDFENVTYLDAIMCFEYFEHEPDPKGLVEKFWDQLRPGGYLICNARSFNPHDTGHLEQNFHYQFNFEENVIAPAGFKCIYFPYNPPNIWNIAVFQKVGKDEGEYNGATTAQGEW